MARPSVISREEIDEVALGLFLTHGFERVTANDVAAACGISRPTLFRHVGTMADVVLDQVRAFGDRTVERFLATPGPAWEAVGTAFASCVAELDGSTPMGRAFAVLAANPDIRGNAMLLTRRWRHDLADAIGARIDEPSPVCEAVAGAAIGLMTAGFAGGWDAATVGQRFTDARRLIG